MQSRFRVRKQSVLQSCLPSSTKEVKVFVPRRRLKPAQQPKLTSLPAKSRAEQLLPLHLELLRCPDRFCIGLHKDDSPRGVHAYALCGSSKCLTRDHSSVLCPRKERSTLIVIAGACATFPVHSSAKCAQMALHALEPRQGRVFRHSGESW